MLGRVPLVPLFLKGNATPTIPYKLRYLKGSAFQFGTADAAAALRQKAVTVLVLTGATVYEVNPWLWQFGRGRPRIGGLSVSETKERRDRDVGVGAGANFMAKESRDLPPPRGS